MQKHLERKSKEGEEMRFVDFAAKQIYIVTLVSTISVTIAYYLILQFIIFPFCRKLVEQTMLEHENTKEARRKLQEYKQKLGEKFFISTLTIIIIIIIIVIVIIQIIS